MGTHEFIRRRHEFHPTALPATKNTENCDWINKLTYIRAHLQEIKVCQSMGTKSTLDPHVFARYEEYLFIQPETESLRELEIYKSSKIYLQQQLQDVRETDKHFDVRYLKYISQRDEDTITKKLRQLREYSDEMYSQIQAQGNELNRIDSNISRVLKLGIKSQINIDQEIQDNTFSLTRWLTWHLIAGNSVLFGLNSTKWLFWYLISLI